MGSMKTSLYKKRIARKPAIIVVVLLAAAVAAALYFLQDGKMETVPYKTFYEMVEQGKVVSATFDGTDIVFEVSGSEGDDAKTSYRTTDPQSPVLKEFLLRNGVAVTQEMDIGSIVSLIFDIFFYAYFFGIFFVAFRKFISPNTFKVVRKTGKTFKDVVGMDSLKRDMLQIMQILKNPGEYAQRGVRAPKGILLEGAPGNGKTLFARALAGEADINFIPAKATDFESMFMAIGPLKVKLLFRKARRRAPCIVFIDEFDGIGTRRNYSGSAIETENTRIVTALLNELDGFEPTNGVLVIAATNSIQALDEALIRPGRFDARVSVPYPDEAARKKLVELYCQGKPHETDCSPESLAALFNKFSCAKIESVLNRASLIARGEEREAFTMQDVRRAMEEQHTAR